MDNLANVYVDLLADSKGRHFSMTENHIGLELQRRIEAKTLKGWQVLLVGQITEKAMIDTLYATTPKLLIVTQAIVRHTSKETRRDLRRIIRRKACFKVLYQHDVHSPLWWADTQSFRAFIGAVLYPSPAYLESLQKFWPGGSPRSRTIQWLPHALPFHYALTCMKDRPVQKIIFPSRSFDNTYPCRKKWQQFISSKPALAHVTTYLHLKHQMVGQAFIQHIAQHVACFVVVPCTGYLVRKMFETLATGTLLLIAFPSDLSRQMWHNLGFRENIHYLEVTFDNVGALFPAIIKNPRSFEAIAKKGYELVYERHTVETRTDELVTWTRSLHI